MKYLIASENMIYWFLGLFSLPEKRKKKETLNETKIIEMFPYRPVSKE